MYKHHPSCLLPDDPNASIWRYMDFTKFVALLDSHNLYLPSLVTLDDKFEGALTRPTLDEFRANPPVQPSDTEPESLEEQLELLSVARRRLYVSSWHLNEIESAAMWRLYLTSGDGVAIRSTLHRLQQSLDAATDEVHIGMVNYIDYESARFAWTDIVSWALHKRRSFAHEREIRALVVRRQGVAPGGVEVAVNLDNLVDAVFVAPTAPSWVVDLIMKVSQKYGLDARPIQSSLNKGPLY